MLSSSQAEKFLVEKLGFEDWQSKLNKDKLRFVKELVRRYSATMYYENLTWGAMKPEEWARPTIPEIIEKITNTAGGTCIHLNYFIKLLLETLGFDAFVVPAPVTYISTPDNHILVILRFPSSEDSVPESESQYYMIDVGNARPIIDLVPLSEKKPFIGKCAGFEFQYRLNPQTRLYERIIKGGCPLRGKFEDESAEEVDYAFGTSPVKFEHFDHGMDLMFTKPEATFFLHTTFVYHITSLNVEKTEDPDLDYEYVCCVGRRIATGTRNTRQETKYDSYIAMLPDILKWFPLLNPDIVRQALLNYDQQRRVDPKNDL